MIMCLSCWDVFDREVLRSGMSGEMWCPKRSCNQEVADIDECLIPAIRALNEKGYYTVSCCSGHFWGNGQAGWTNQYVRFQESVKENDLGKLPDGFSMDINDNGNLTIRREFQNDDLLGLHMEILKSSVSLTEWARELPDINED